VSREFIIFIGVVVGIPCLYLLGKRRHSEDDEEDTPE
jgi:hypothetical protein